VRTKVAVTLGSVVLGVLIVAGAYLASGSGAAGGGRGEETATAVSPGPVTRAELAAADGRDGRPCLVAVDGVVYQIQGFTLWREGEHLPSEGRAYCGADMSEVIREAPHGTDKLELLREIGPLQP